MRLKNQITIVVVLLLAASAATAEDEGWRFWLLAQEEYRARISGAADSQGGLVEPLREESDHDLRLFLDGGLRDPGDHFGVDLSLGLWWDVDGELPDGNPSAFGSVYDYRQPWWDVFTLSAEYRSQGAFKLVRGGRQASDFGLPVTFDGASLLFSAVRPTLDLFVFGGRSVHFFETQTGAFEDWIGSIGAVIRPGPSLRLEVDYRFLREDTLRDQYTRDDLIDHTYGLSGWYRNGDWLLSKAYLRGLNDSLSHAGAALRFWWPAQDLGADVNLDVQLITLDEINERNDPYFVLLGESLPNLRWRVDAWKVFETRAGEYGVHAGWNGKHILDGDAGPFNRNSGRIYLLGQAEDVGIKGLFLTLAAEGHYTYLDGRLSTDMILAIGGSAGYRSRIFKSEIGTYYQRFKYDYYRDLREVEDVRTFFGLVAWKATDWLAVKVRYEFERADRNIHTVSLVLSQTY